MTLESIYQRALQACAPDVLTARMKDGSYPRTVAAIGKCAGALLDGFGAFDEAFVVLPSGYPKPKRRATVFEGGHPQMTHASFVAGKALLDFVAAHDEITFLISGGGSACVEWPLPGHTEEEVIALNASLLRSGLSIHEINEQRKRVSAIKGGRLNAGVKRSVTLVYSDVSTDALADVASGPTVGHGEVELIADNRTLCNEAANLVRESGGTPVMWGEQIETDVDDAAAALAQRAGALKRDEVLIAGGEPTVVQHGDGKGGRCSELAVRFASRAQNQHVRALFGSSDGVDGNSGAAAVIVDLPVRMERAFVERELARSNSMAVIDAIGRSIPARPTGNNLRDLYLLACS